MNCGCKRGLILINFTDPASSRGTGIWNPERDITVGASIIPTEHFSWISHPMMGSCSYNSEPKYALCTTYNVRFGRTKCCDQCMLYWFGCFVEDSNVKDSMILYNAAVCELSALKFTVMYNHSMPIICILSERRRIRNRGDTSGRMLR